MRNTTLSLLLLFILTSQVSAQIPYYDAADLGRFVNTGTIPHRFKNDAASLDTVVGIIKKYYPDITSNNRDEIITLIKTRGSQQFNPILAQYLNVTLPNAVANASPSKSIFTAVGNLNVTNFVDGLAKFLIERSKEELNIAFFRKFQEWITSYPEAKICFPSTVSVINNIAAYNYSAMLPALRTNFQKDLNSLCSNVLDLRDYQNYDGYNLNPSITARANHIIHFFDSTYLGRSAAGALVMARGIIAGDNAADVIDAFAQDRSCNIDDNFSNLVQFVNLISKSLRSQDTGRIWVTNDQIKQLVSNEDGLQLYFGLLYAVDQHPLANRTPITLRTGANNVLTFQRFVDSLHAKWNSPAAIRLKQDFKRLALFLSNIADQSKAIVQSLESGNPADIMAYIGYVSSIGDFIKSGLTFIRNHPGIDSMAMNIQPTYEPYIGVMSGTLDACYDVKSKNYTSLVLHFSQIIDALPSTSSQFTREFVKYATFIASVAEAKNSDEVKDAIDAVVLPVGSSSIKRESFFNIAINSYIGPFYGQEYMPTLKTNQWAPVVGIAAPVGIAFSWGSIGNGRRNKAEANKPDSLKKHRGGKSISLFLPLIDVGAVASFRINDDQSEVASEIKLANIVAPGAYLYYGFGKCPISVGFGGQFGPQLREVTTTDIKAEKNFYFRFAVNVLVDIPFFNLYTKN